MWIRLCLGTKQMGDLLHEAKRQMQAKNCSSYIFQGTGVVFRPFSTCLYILTLVLA